MQQEARDLFGVIRLGLSFLPMVRLPMMWGFPNSRGTILGVSIIRTIVCWGLFWGPLILRNYHVELVELGGEKARIVNE